MTQADLAFAAESSTRHLSCLETGKAQPSREMIARLAEYLEIPLRDQNTLLLAAGFAPAFQERSLPALDAAKTAIEAILKAHKPYPAMAIDRHWNVVTSNSALPQLYEGCSADLLRAPVNAVRLDAASGRSGAAHRELRRVARPSSDRASPADRRSRRLGPPGPVRRGLGLSDAAQFRIRRVASAPPSAWRRRSGVATRLGVMSFLGTVTVFGTPNDVTLWPSWRWKCSFRPTIRRPRSPRPWSRSSRALG